MRWIRLLAAAAVALGLAAQDRDRPPSVSVDPRLELLAVVQQLSDYNWTGLLNTDDSAYRREVLARFAPWRDHQAVQLFSLAARYGYAYDAPVATMVCLSAPPELVLQSAPENCAADRAGGAANTELWLAQLRDFALQSRFTDFFEAHRALYQAMEEQTRAKLAYDYAVDLEDYCGVRQASHAVYLTPLLRGNYGVRVPQDDGALTTFAVVGAVGASSGVAQFGEASGLRMLLWHEFGHSLINPVVDANAALLAPSAALYAPIEAKMRAQAYSNWRTAVIEHLVRTVVAGVAALRLSSADGDVEVLRQRGQGFAYVPALYQRLREYEGDRATYPRFALFIGRLLAAFDELAAQDLPAAFFRAPYAGTINSVYAERDRIVIVLPTGEDDAAAQAAIRSQAGQIRDLLFKTAVVIDDRDALDRDLAGNSVLAYGTLDGNLWLRRYRDRFPLTLRNGKVVAGAEEYSGSHLRLILSAPHPGNPDSGIVVYTAARAADVVNINAVVHGSTGYVVADDRMVLKAGDYVLHDGTWMLP